MYITFHGFQKSLTSISIYVFCQFLAQIAKMVFALRHRTEPEIYAIVKMDGKGMIAVYACLTGNVLIKVMTPVLFLLNVSVEERN